MIIYYSICFLYKLQPLTTWLFTQHYFESVTSLVERTKNKCLHYFLFMYYPITTLAVFAVYLVFSISDAILIFTTFYHPLQTKEFIHFS
jgi:hypothetical protein